MTLAALICSAGIAFAQASEPQGKVVLQCAGMISIYDMVIPTECRVVLDFDKRLVFHRDESFRIESATESFVGFAYYDDVKHIGTFTGGLDRVTGSLTLSGTPESKWSATLKCQEQRATVLDVTIAAARQAE